MSISARPISAQELDDFYNAFEGEKTFLQTSKFGDFREQLGEQTFRLGFLAKDIIVAVAQCQRITARRGTFLHVPHGPLLLPLFEKEGAGGRFSPASPLPGGTEGGSSLSEQIFTHLINLAKTEGCDFLRISPIIPSSNTQVIPSSFRPSPLHINPDRTWILDLTQSEEDLLKNMRKSTRYEVRRIEKEGIEIKMGNTKDDLDIFWHLHEKTVARQQFVPFAKKNTQIELDIFGEDCQIFSAGISSEYFASSVILFDQHAAYYHQGASVRHKLPFAHATLWAAILEAKKRGCREFNFWGVCPEERQDHPWQGLSKFKRGFGGEERVFVPAHDYPITMKYWLNFAVEKYRKWKRRY